MKTTRRDAIQARENKYHTGIPCKYGHLAARWTIDGMCVRCRVNKTLEARAALRLLLRKER